MHSGTSSYYKSNTEPRWDRDTLIQIINPVEGWGTCVGHAPSKKRRCWNRKNPKRADSILGKLAKLDPKTIAAAPQLWDVAESMLCWLHGNQIDSVVSEWKHALKNEAANQGRYCNMSELEASMQALFDQLLEMRRTEEQMRKETYYRSQFRSNKPQVYTRDIKHTNEAYASRKIKLEEEEEDNRQREREKREKERLRRERLERERLEKERLERKRQERKRKEKEEKARLEQERREQERQAKEKREREAKLAREARAAAAEQRRLLELQEWKDAWTRYTQGWKAVDEDQRVKSTPIPWPTRSGKWEDVNNRNVRDFFRQAPILQASTESSESFSLMTTENKRWHTDKILYRFGREVLDGERKNEIDMISKLMVVLWKEAKSDRSKV